MAQIRPCPFCGGGHRTKRAAKKCARRHGKAKKWTLAELGMK